eukprot:COSAG01_NODE_138_length_24329_cov_45.428229_4_plen_149_part_00
MHCRKRLAGKLRRGTLWRPGFAALTNREGCPLHNAAGWPRVEVNLMPAAGSWILQSFCSLVSTGTAVLYSRRALWPGHKPICIDRPGADLCIDCCTQLDQPKSRLYAARALSAESPQQSAVVAYSRDFGLRPGQAVNRVPAGYSVNTP